MRILTALSASAVTNVASTTGVDECDNVWFERNDINIDVCRNKVLHELFNGDEKKFADAMFMNLQGERAKEKTTSKLANVGAVAGTAIGVAGSVVGIDAGQDEVASSIAMFYMSIAMAKSLLKIILPLVLMTIYMFWGVYMTIGEFKGYSMIKGMFLIMVLTLVPSLWALVEHLDDALYTALYGSTGAGGIALGISPIGDVFTKDYLEQGLIDTASGIFQISIMFVLFCLVNEAGGTNANGAIRDSQGSAQGFSGSMRVP